MSLVPVGSVPAAEYTYLAIVNTFYPDVAYPSAVVRRWESLPGIIIGELFSRALRWVHTAAYEIVAARQSEGRIVQITEEAARRFEVIQAERVRTEPVGRRYVYYAVLSSSDPDVNDPQCVGRKWDDGNGRVHQEIYGTDCAWVPDLRQALPSDEHPEIDEAAVRRFEEIQAERYANHLPVDGQFSYVAIASSPGSDDAYGLVRTWPSRHGPWRDEEDFSPADRRWRWGSTLDAIARGSDPGHAIPISRDVAERLRITLVERRRAREERESRVYDYYAITSDGRTVDDPVTVVRVWTPETGDPVEERYERLRWEPTDLRRRVPEQDVAQIDDNQLYRFTVLQSERLKRGENRPS